MPSEKSADATCQSIAEDLADYLRETDGVCAEGNVHSWRWVRHHDGQWQAAKYANGGGHRLKSYVKAEVLHEREVLAWLESKPATIVPQSEAYLWGPSENTVWEDADRQDVFGYSNRCFWCGESEFELDLGLYKTYEHSEIYLCEDCHESWESSGELADSKEVPA